MARTDYYGIKTTDLTATSSAIRAVNNTSDLIAPENYAELISTMKSGADYQNVLDQMVEETATGAIASFTDGANNIPCKEIICHINPTETGTGEKSPSNPYVIGGHTEINVVCTGKNLANIFVDGKVPSTTTGTLVNAGGARTDFIKCFSREQYTLSCSNSQALYVFYYDENQGFLNYSSLTGTTLTITTPLNAEYLMLRFGSNTVNNGMLEKGATATTFEPYTGNTYNITFGQTVYGGTLNVTTGVLTIDRGYKLLNGSETWTNYPNYNGFYHSIPEMKGGTNVSGIANRFAVRVGWTQMGIRLGAGNRNAFFVQITNNIEGVTNVITWKAWLSNNPVQLIYPLATPLTIQLTPQEINTLLGTNNIYHDCNGDTDVTYRANGALYVQEHPIT